MLKKIKQYRDRRVLAPFFNTDFYRQTYPDVVEAGIDPLSHFLASGWRESRNPSPDFDTAFYLARYPDVAASGMNPLLHYAKYGWREGREIKLPMIAAQAAFEPVSEPGTASGPEHELEPQPQAEPEHPPGPEHEPDSQASVARRLVGENIDREFYLATYGDVREAGLDPAEHFLQFGWREFRKPTENFNTAYYLKAHPDVRASGMNPFVHYLLHGRKEGRAISSPILDLLQLKPVPQPWRPTQGLAHRYDISVVIPTYNRATMLPSLIEAWKVVEQRTRYSYELIFSDDGSSDDTQAVIEAHAGDLPLTLLRNEHGGASRARNAAVRIAAGAKILFMGDDIYPDPEILNQHIEKHKQIPVTHAVLGECGWHPDLEVNHLMKHITEIGCEQFSFLHLPRQKFVDFRHFYTCNISIDRDFLLSEKVIFDERFYLYGFEDIELGYRLAKKGMQIFYLPEAWGNHYHSYKDVRKFCLRQEFAGEMAAVFEKLHPELRDIVPLDEWCADWAAIIAVDAASVGDSYGILVAICQECEDRRAELHDEQLGLLSKIYARLFAFAMEMGYVRTQLPECTDAKVNQVLKEKVVDDEIITALEALHAQLKLARFADFVRFWRPDRASPGGTETRLSDNPQSQYTGFEDQNPRRLVVECDGLETLARLRRVYGDMDGELLFSLKSDVHVDAMVYAPKTGGQINPSNLAQLLLFVKHNPEVDQIVLSFGLHALPNIGVRPGEGVVTLARPGPIRRGKIIRLFGEGEAEPADMGEVLGKDVILADHYGNFARCVAA